MAEVFTLTRLQYGTNRDGPWKLYLYETEGRCHSGAHWFEKDYIDHSRTPDYIAGRTAKQMTDQAIREKLEVRITDLRDFLVFHTKDGKVLHPPPPQDFWQEIGVSQTAQGA